MGGATRVEFSHAGSRAAICSGPFAAPVLIVILRCNIGGVAMAVTQEGLSATSELPAKTFTRSESAGRLIIIAIGWWLLTELISGVPVGILVFALKRTHFQNISLASPIIVTVMVFLASCTLLFAVRRRSVIVGNGDRRAGVDDRPITRWWVLVVLALLMATWGSVALGFWNAVQPQWASSWRGESSWTL